MPIPLVAIAAAYASGGSMVAHAGGGLIMTGASGYIAGTYLSTAAVSALLAAGVSALGAGAAVATGLASSVIGSAGLFGTTIGATGITGFLMSVGLVHSTPIWVPAAIGGAATGVGYGAYKYWRLREKVAHTPAGQEAIFTESEAKLVDRILRRMIKQNRSELS